MQMFSIRLLLITLLCSFTSLSYAQEYSAGQGEIRFDGTLASFDKTGKTLVINVSSFTLPSGKSSKLTTPKPKMSKLGNALRLSEQMRAAPSKRGKSPSGTMTAEKPSIMAV